jgi:hypothetical protein
MVKLVVHMKNNANMVRDWVTYHGSMFGYENIVALDYGSTDGTFEMMPKMKVATYRSNKTTIQNEFQHVLDASNEFVFVLDMGEFVVPLRDSKVTNESIVDCISSLPWCAVYKMPFIYVPCSTEGLLRPVLQSTQGVGTQKSKFFFNTRHFRGTLSDYADPCSTTLAVVRYDGSMRSKHAFTSEVDITSLVRKIQDLTTKKGILGIVARYNESLDWMLEEPFNQIRYIVYNKGTNDAFCKTNVVAVVNLPNVGRCDHTYLYHIVEHYADKDKDKDIDDLLVFLPGSCGGTSYKKNKAVAVLNHTIRKHKPCMVLFGRVDVRATFADFTLDKWQCSDDTNKSANSEELLTPCELRPFGKWFDAHFGDTQTNFFSVNGIFSVTRRMILSRGLKEYVALLEEVGVSSNPEVGHYLERSWGTIFGNGFDLLA